MVSGFGHRPAVLAYHAVGPVPSADDPHGLVVDPGTFEEQMEYLALHRHVVSVSDTLAADSHHLPRGTVAITFDDGYRSVYELALPVLERLRLPATVFVPTAYVGGFNEWEDAGREPLAVMTSEELEDAEARGLAVESHGHRHIDLAASEPDEIRRDLGMSLEVLAGIVKRPVRFLAYPYGQASKDARETAKSLGIRGAFTTNRDTDGPFFRSRISVNTNDSSRLFHFKTAGFYETIREPRGVPDGDSARGPMHVLPCPDLAKSCWGERNSVV